MSLVKELRAASKLFKPEAHAAADYIEQLEKQRDQLLADLATAEQDSRQKQARIDRLKRERDELLAALKTAKRKMDSATICHPKAMVHLLAEAYEVVEKAIDAARGVK